MADKPFYQSTDDPDMDTAEKARITQENIRRSKEFHEGKAAKKAASLKEAKEIDPNSLEGMLANRPEWAISQYDNLTARDLMPEHEARYSDIDMNLRTKNLMPGIEQRYGAAADKIGPTEMYGQGADDLQKLRDRAFGTGASPWAQAQMDSQRFEEQTGMEGLSREAALGQQQQLAQMAAQGGLSGGARERMGTAAGRNQMMAEQQMRRAGQAARMGITAEDERQRAALQQQMPGMALGFEQYRTGLSQQDRNIAMAKASQLGQFDVGEEQRRAAMDQANRAAQMQKAGQLGQFAEAGVTRGLGVEQYNQQRALASEMAKQQFEMEKWRGGLQAKGAQAESDALARQSRSGGGLFSQVAGIFS